MKALIVSGGKAPSIKLLKDELIKCNLIICADKGAECLIRYGIYPDILLGDFDSINEDILNNLKNKNVNIVKFCSEKDFTDTEAAVEKAIESGADQIVLLGCTGSRLDHVLGNIGMLLKCLNLGVKATIKDENNEIFLIDKPTKIYGKKGDVFSLLAYSCDVENLTIIGAKYPLKNYNLKIGSAIGVSNEFIEEEVILNFTKGTLLVAFSKD